MLNDRNNEASITIHKSNDNCPKTSIQLESKVSATRYTTIDTSLTFHGDLESNSDLLVQGGVVGNVTCNRLFVDASAFVEGYVEANEVIIRGCVVGIVKADKVHLTKTAQVESEIYQNKFVAEEGAFILGKLNNINEAPAQRISRTTPENQTDNQGHQQPSAAGEAPGLTQRYAA